MALKDILSQIDAEIGRLQQAKALLAGAENSITPATRRGRPSKNVISTIPVKSPKKKRNLSPEGRARIAEAVKRRWASQKAKQKKT
jgi:hypothetical protein